MKKIMLNSSVILAIIGISACSSVNGTSNPASVSVTNNKIGECANEVAKVSLTPSANNASLKVDAVTPATFGHNYKVVTIDLSGFTSNGVLTIKGNPGTQGKTSNSIVSTSADLKCSGAQEGQLAEALNVEPGKSFEVKYNFTPGQTVRFLSEGSWGGVKDTINNVDLSISAR